MVSVAWNWTPEDQADIDRAERRLDELLYARPRSRPHAETIRFQVDSCRRGIVLMRRLKERLT